MKKQFALFALITAFFGVTMALATTQTFEPGRIVTRKMSRGVLVPRNPASCEHTIVLVPSGLQRLNERVALPAAGTYFIANTGGQACVADLLLDLSDGPADEAPMEAPVVTPVTLGSN